MLRSVSMASALRNSTPSWAPRPVATMMEIGVASPARRDRHNEHGHCIHQCVCQTRLRPSSHQPTKVTIAIAMTVGTNQAATRSASFCRGARERCG